MIFPRGREWFDLSVVGLMLLGVGTGVVVWADRDRLIQVVVNLIQNAVKYTPEDGEITVAIESPNRRFVRILVRDTGPGIPPENLETVFEVADHVAVMSRGSVVAEGAGERGGRRCGAVRWLVRGLVDSQSAG